MALAAAGALSVGIDALSALFSPSSAKKKTGFNAASAFNVSGTTASPTPASANSAASKLSPATFSALLDAQGQTQTNATGAATAADRPALLNKLFSALDTNGDGQIAKSEFQDQLGAGGTNLANADSVFGKLDKNGDGSLSIDELSAVLNTSKKHRPHRPGEGNGQDPLLKALDGASSKSTTGSDGSSSTSVTYADGSTVTLTKPASNAASVSAASSYNFVERAILQQSRLLSASSSAAVKVSA